MAVKGTKQSPEHIRKRIEAVAKARETWTDEQRESFANKIRDAIYKRDPEAKRKFMFANVGREPWNKGKKFPQYSGSNHWNWGNNMPQESIEKMRKSLIGKKQSAEVIRKRFAWSVGYRPSMETKVKVSVANSGRRNGNWLGGMSREPYTLIWGSSLFKGTIRKRDNHTCQNPECKKNCSVLSIHHIDYDKKNCNPKNLITLCRSCNGRANFNREFWEADYKEIIRLKYGVDQQQMAV
jgi:hypothetical protein